MEDAKRQAQRDGDPAPIEAFLNTYPGTRWESEARAAIWHMEFSAWYDARESGDWRVVEQFAQQNPDSEYATEAREQVNALRSEEKYRREWEEEGDRVLSVDKVSSYEYFLEHHRSHPRVEEARRRLAELREIRAEIVLKSPEMMTPVRIGNTYHDRFEWKATFEEVGGVAGASLSSDDFYIEGPGGSRWTHNWAKSVVLEPGGTATADYWISYSKKWAGGKFHCVWKGRDTSGNRVSILHEVQIPRKHPFR